MEKGRKKKFGKCIESQLWENSKFGRSHIWIRTERRKKPEQSQIDANGIEN